MEPWIFDPLATDREGFAVIRDADEAPIVYLDKSLTGAHAARVAGMIVALPEMVTAIQEIVFSQEMGTDWSDDEWTRWRKKVGPALARAMGMS